jgi:hypothetical protein
VAKFISVEFSTDFNRIVPQLRKQQRAIERLPQQALDEFIKNTPVRSGAARQSTRLTGDTIRADYAYAGRLDGGYSAQSPDGMTKPTEQFIQRRFRAIFGK